MVRRYLSWMVLVSLPLAAGCGGDDEPSSHSVSARGIMHRPGLEQPLNNCVDCHGVDLEGDEGPSCYSCHADPSSHTVNRGGVAHKPGDSSTCTTCHGPDNTGGLGPACTDCHD